MLLHSFAHSLSFGGLDSPRQPSFTFVPTARIPSTALRRRTLVLSGLKTPSCSATSIKARACSLFVAVTILYSSLPCYAQTSGGADATVCTIRVTGDQVTPRRA